MLTLKSPFFRPEMCVRQALKAASEASCGAGHGIRASRGHSVPADFVSSLRPTKKENGQKMESEMSKCMPNAGFRSSSARNHDV